MLHSRVQEGPVQLHGRLGADSWEASGVLDPDVKVHEWSSETAHVHTYIHVLRLWNVQKMASPLKHFGLFHWEDS